MRSKGSRTHLEIVLEAIGAGLVLWLLLQMLGCAHVTRGGREPEWVPHVYIKSVGTPCRFIDSYGDAIDCANQTRMDDFILIPDADLMSLKSKLQRCARWE